jgi:hypothetical protein
MEANRAGNVGGVGEGEWSCWRVVCVVALDVTMRAVRERACCSEPWDGNARGGGEKSAQWVRALSTPPNP